MAVDTRRATRSGYPEAPANVLSVVRSVVSRGGRLSGNAVDAARSAVAVDLV